MQKKWSKILRFKVGLIASLLVLSCVALQAPWVKQQIASKLSEKLAQLTDSEVSIKSFEGFVPLTFDLYRVEFNQKGQTWLTVEKVSLHHSLLRLLFWKNKKLSLSLYQPTWIQAPSFYSEGEFSLKDLPFKSLSARVGLYDLKLGSSSEGSNVSWNFINRIQLKRSSQTLELKTSIFSNTSRSTQGQVFFKLDEAQDFFKTRLNWKDKDQFILKNATFPFNLTGSASLSGSYLALVDTFKDKQESENKTFQGEALLSAYPTDQAHPFLITFFGKSALNLATEVKNTSQNTLKLDQLKLTSKYLTLEGGGELIENFALKNFVLDGELSSFDFLPEVYDSRPKGFLPLSTEIEGTWDNLAVSLSLSKGKFLAGSIDLQDIDLTAKAHLSQQMIDYETNGKVVLNQNLISLDAKGQFQSLQNFNFEEVSISSKDNEVRVLSLVKNGALYQGIIDFDLSNLSLLSPFLRQSLLGQATGRLELDSPQNAQWISLEAQGDKFQYQNTKMSDYFVKTEGQVNFNDFKKVEGPFYLKAQSFQNAPYALKDLQLEWRPFSDQYEYALSFSGDLAVNSTGSWKEDDGNKSLNIYKLSGAIEEKPFNLSYPVRLEYGPKGTTFSTIQLLYQGGRAYLDIDQNNHVNIDLTQFPLSFLSPLMSKSHLEGTVTLQGSLKDLKSPKGNIKGFFKSLSLKEYPSMSKYSGQFNWEIKPKHLSGQLTMNGKNKDSLNANFKFPLKTSFSPLKLRVEKKVHSEIDLEYTGFINPFFQLLMPEGHLFEGQTQMNLQLRGPLNHLSAQGHWNIHNGYYENLFLGLVLKNLDAELKGIGSKLKVSSLKAEDEQGGKIDGEGHISLDLKDHMPFHFHVDLTQGQIIQFDFLEAAFNGRLIFEGNLKKPLLRGNLDVTKATFTIPNTIGSSLPKLDVTYKYPHVNNPCSANENSLIEPIRFDLHLDTVEPIALKGRGLDTVWTGHLDLLGTSFKPDFKGEFKKSEGSFVFSDKVLKLEEGFIKFDGNLIKDTYINLTGSTRVYNARITAYLKGPLVEPKLNFRSDPAYSETEILSLLLFNEPVQKLTPFQAVALTHSLATLSGAYLGPDVVDKVRKGIGVDQLTFGSAVEGEGEYYTVQIGKYITRNVLITLNQPIKKGNAPFTLTAHIKGGFQIQTHFDESELSKILIQWKLSY